MLPFLFTTSRVSNDSEQQLSPIWGAEPGGDSEKTPKPMTCHHNWQLPLRIPNCGTLDSRELVDIEAHRLGNKCLRHYFYLQTFSQQRPEQHEGLQSLTKLDRSWAEQDSSGSSYQARTVRRFGTTSAFIAKRHAYEV